MLRKLKQTTLIEVLILIALLGILYAVVIEPVPLVR